MIAQIDEQKLTMIALAVDPARQPSWSALVAEAQLATMVGAVGMHAWVPDVRRRSGGSAGFVNLPAENVEV
jgi:hypothetical protein